MKWRNVKEILPGTRHIGGTFLVYIPYQYDDSFHMATYAGDGEWVLESGESKARTISHWAPLTHPKEPTNV